MRRPGLDPRRARTTFFSMLDGRTNMAKHTKWIGLLLFAILAVTVVIEALG